MTNGYAAMIRGLKDFAESSHDSINPQRGSHCKGIGAKRNLRGERGRNRWGESETQQRSGHEGEEQDDESEESSEVAGEIERSGVVNGSDAKKTDAEKKGSPKIPAVPKEIAEREKSERKEVRGEAMKARKDRAKDVTAIELASGKEIQGSGEEADPCGTTDGIEKDDARGRAGVKERGEKAEEQRSAENDFGVRRVNDAGRNFSVNKAEEQRRNADEKSDERSRRTDIKESTVGAHWRADENECAEGANQGWEWNEEWITRMNVMVAAGEEMAEFVGEKDGEESCGERHAGEKAERILVEKGEGAEKLVERNRLVVSVGHGKLRAGNKASRKSGEEEKNGEDEGFERGTRKNRSVGFGDGSKRVPVNGGREGVEGGI